METHTRMMCRERVTNFGVLGPKSDVSIKPLPPGLKDLCGRGSRKIVGASGMDDIKETVFS